MADNVTTLASTNVNFTSTNVNFTSTNFNFTSTNGSDLPEPPCFYNDGHLQCSGTLSREQYEQARFIMFPICMPVICVVGTVGNSMSLFILWSSRGQSSFYIYLRTLTVSDIILLIMGFLRAFPKMIEIYNPHVGRMLEAYFEHVFGFFLGQMMSKVSASFIVVLSLERFLAVLKPMKVKNYLIARHPYRVLLAVLLFQLLVHLPTIVWTKVFSREDPLTNSTIYFIEYVDWAKELPFRRYYYYFVLAINMVTPVLAVVVLNTGISILLVRHKRNNGAIQLSKESGGSMENNKLTLTLVAMSVFFILSTMPSIVLYLLTAVNKEFRVMSVEHYLFGLIVDIGILFILLNSANDFVIYILMSKKFKTLFFEQYCCCTKHLETATANEERESQSSSADNVTCVSTIDGSEEIDATLSKATT